MVTRQFGSSALSSAEKDALIRCVAASIVKQEIPEIKPDSVALNGGMLVPRQRANPSGTRTGGERW